MILHLRFSRWLLNDEVAGLCSIALWMAFSLCVCAGCSTGADESVTAADSDLTETAAPAAPPPALVRTQVVRREFVSPTVVGVGTVMARDSSVVASASDGVVEEFNVERGDFVASGTILSRLRMVSTDLALEEQRAVLAEREAMYRQAMEPRKEDVEEARAQQMAAEATLQNAERRLRELRSLEERGATNQSAVEDAEDIYAEAKQRALAAKAVFARVASGTREEEKIQARSRFTAQEKHVAWLEAEKEKRITRAPFAGFIASEDTYPGQWLSKGDPVARLVILDEVDVSIPIDQTFIGQVKPGAEVRVHVNGCLNPSADDGHWSGRIMSIVPQSDWSAGSRSFPVIVRVTNIITETDAGPVPVLREGMMAEVEFSGTPIEALIVPKDSLVRTSRGTFVYALNVAEDGSPPSVRQVSVEPGLSTDGWTQVQTDDLAPGVQVVTEGAERLRPFQSVSVIADPVSGEGR